MSRAAEEAVFKALADGRRRKMLDLLKAAPLTTGDLCAEFPQLNRCTVMQHLGVLERAGLILVKREGRLRWNYINPLPIKAIHDRWISPHARNAVAVLERMKREIDKC